MNQLLDKLNDEQKQAVTHGIGPLLIVAGAGTGKTTVITRRMAYLIEQKLAKPDEILALTFTEKAAGEMQERVDILLDLGYYDGWISTFHSFCQRILERHALDIGLSNDFKLLDETKAWILIHDNFEKFNLNYYRPLGNPQKFISALIKHFSRCKDELITPREYLEYAQELRLQTDQPNRTTKEKEGGGKREDKITPHPSPLTPTIANETEISRLEELANAFHVYQKLLLDNNFLDFGDLINYALELFQKRPNILRLYQNKFKYIMVDEFQDTNYAQYQLVKMLAGDCSQPIYGLKTADKSANYKPNCNLVVVGDDDQSIYKFRGASVSNILKFREDYPSSKQITLIENYRSTQDILDLAYKVIQNNNPDRLEMKLKTDKRLLAVGSGLKPFPTGTIEAIEGQDLSQELNLVCKKILELKNQSASSADTSWNDFAILIRSNSAAEPLLPLLAQAGIPHTFLANTGLYDKPLIADLIAYFRLLDNFHDSFSLYRVLSGFDIFRLEPQEISSLLEHSQRKAFSLYEMLQTAKTAAAFSEIARQKLQKLESALNKHAMLAGQRAANETFVEIVKDLGLEKKLEAETLENAESRELLEQFYKKTESFVGENADKSLHNFLRVLNLEIEAGDEGQIKFDPNLGPESLKVLTLHSAKGLEFENVFIVNLVDQRFPTRARPEPIEIPKKLIKDILPEGDFHLQEERRLFYVGATRAKSRLFFSWAKDYGGSKPKQPSLFLQEAGLVPVPKPSEATGKVIFSKPQKREAVFQKLPDSFSFSAIKTFETCPLQYKYQYYLKLPSRGSSYFSFGQTIHKVFELYLKELQNRQTRAQGDLFGQKKNGKTDEAPDIKFLEELYKNNWVDEWYKDKKQKEEYRKKGRLMLKTFYEHCLQNPPAPKFLEQSFLLFFDKYKFTGKIDRADQTKEGLVILDYKTSEKIPQKNDRGDLDQLYVYQWAAEEHLKEKVSGLAYWYLQDNKFLREEVADGKKIAVLKSRLLETMEKIVHTVKYDLFKEEHGKLKNHKCEFAK